LHDAVTGTECLLGLESGVAVVKDRLPGTSNRIPTDVANPIWSRPGRVEHTVVGDKRQGGLEVVLCPGRAEALHYRERVHLKTHALYLA
jgi:hypothetical protein